jgi:ligand-binding SRPBCC domain-containing protein
MIVLNTYQIKTPLEQVATFHQHSANMTAITPPPILVRMHAAPAELSDGDQIAFTLWFGPLPVYWRLRIENASLNGFEDHQIDGPFQQWVHHHRFNALDETTTEVTDEVHLQLKAKLPEFLIGLGMLLGMPLLFAYRAWKTRRLVASLIGPTDEHQPGAHLTYA